MIILRTVSDRVVDLNKPTVEMIDVYDIACGLSKVCRFAGQISTFYSVAQHSLLVSSLVPSQFSFQALHHDDTEAYMGDVSRFLKHSELMYGYRVLEERLDDVIKAKLGIVITPWLKDQIKIADDLAAVFEQWTMRFHQRWSPAGALHWAVDGGFVRTTFDDMFAFAHRLPPTYYTPWSSAEAEKRWLEAHRLATQ